MQAGSGLANQVGPFKKEKHGFKFPGKRSWLAEDSCHRLLEAIREKKRETWAWFLYSAKGTAIDLENQLPEK